MNYSVLNHIFVEAALMRRFRKWIIFLLGFVLMPILSIKCNAGGSPQVLSTQGDIFKEAEARDAAKEWNWLETSHLLIESNELELANSRANKTTFIVYHNYYGETIGKDGKISPIIKTVTLTAFMIDSIGEPIIAARKEFSYKDEKWNSKESEELDLCLAFAKTPCFSRPHLFRTTGLIYLNPTSFAAKRYKTDEEAAVSATFFGLGIFLGLAVKSASIPAAKLALLKATLRELKSAVSEYLGETRDLYYGRAHWPNHEFLDDPALKKKFEDKGMEIWQSNCSPVNMYCSVGGVPDAPTSLRIVP